MTSISNILQRTFSYLFSSITPGQENNTNTMKELSKFGASEWIQRFNLHIKEPKIFPPDFQKALDENCSIWPEFLGKQTHVCVLVPENLSEAKLSNHLAGREIIHEELEGKWILMTRQCFPKTKNLPFDLQLPILKENGYRAPSKIEAISAIIAANTLGNLSLFQGRKLATRCSELYNGTYLAVGSPQWYTQGQVFDVFSNTNRTNHGVAGVRD